MFDPGLSSRAHLIHEYYSANWESDVEDVVIEVCDLEEDPSGYRVTYYTDENDARQGGESYCIGASFLQNRLRKLKRAGFDAPMTKKAINLINQKRLLLVS
ncbi:MAG: hypothetical protein ACRBCK_07390 [Alphaproteobacteria bacterium]